MTGALYLAASAEVQAVTQTPAGRGAVDSTHMLGMLSLVLARSH